MGTSEMEARQRSQNEMGAFIAEEEIIVVSIQVAIQNIPNERARARACQAGANSGASLDDCEWHVSTIALVSIEGNLAVVYSSVGECPSLGC